jgi:hypothetical protein
MLQESDRAARVIGGLEDERGEREGREREERKEKTIEFEVAKALSFLLPPSPINGARQ